MNTFTTSQQRAVSFIRKNGMEIIDRNICGHIDIVTWDCKTDEIVFIEVIERKTTPKTRRRNRKIAYHQRKAIRNWLRVNKWHSGHRFDVIEVYGTNKPVINHIQNVNLEK